MRLTHPVAVLIPCLVAGALAPEGDAQIRKRNERNSASQKLDVDRSIFSVLASDDVPASPGPGAAELAPSLGLTPSRVKNEIQYYEHEKTGMEFVFVPGGTFPFGSNYADIWTRPQVVESLTASNINATELDVEQPQMETWLSPYFIGAYEVTNAEYRAFLEAGEAEDCEFPLAPDKLDHEPFKWGEYAEFSGDRQPVAGIGWFDAWAFCTWLGGRLPTEAEWEKAARGTDGRIFPWGNRFDPMRANIAASLNGRTLDVGTYEGGRSPYGCYDMAGNVAEMTTEPWERTAYQYRKAKDPALLERVPLVAFRVARGGSWNMFGRLHRARVTARERVQILPRYPRGIDLVQYLQFGFRVVLSPHQNLYPEGWEIQLTESGAVPVPTGGIKGRGGEKDGSGGAPASGGSNRSADGKMNQGGAGEKKQEDG